jgi:sterol desaturase/sphingolipid hydroxylase (fatty acid hydroxylase superfamily)
MGRRLSLSSKSGKWLVTTFAVGPRNYRLSYAADSFSALLALAWEIRVRQSPLGYVALAGASGYMIWGLSEYAFHRWLYHRPHGILREGHRIHHEDPLVLIGLPWFMTPTFVLGLWYLCSVILRVPFFSACLAGWLVGGVWYSLVHHSHHHWGIRNPWLCKLKAYHRIHHRFPEFNFGVTMRVWDIAFGTRYRKPQIQACSPRVKEHVRDPAPERGAG